MMKRPHFLIRYLIEGILIFGSVYGAFLLEDYRSRAEQENVFNKRWSGLISSMSDDSVKFTDILYSMDGEGFYSNVNLNKWINQDSLVIANYDAMIARGELRPIIEAIKSFNYWPMSWTEEAPYYVDIIENHPDHFLEVCEENPELCQWLDSYSQYHKRIDRYNRYTRELYIQFWDEFRNLYPFPEIASSADSLNMAKDFRSRNYILDRYRHCNVVMRPAIESIVELNKKIVPVLKEIDLD